MLRRFTPGVKVVVVDISAVPLLDMTALAALDNVLRDYRQQGVALILSGPTAQVRLQLRRAGVQRREGELAYVRDLSLIHIWWSSTAHGSGTPSSPCSRPTRTGICSTCTRTPSTGSITAG